MGWNSISLDQICEFKNGLWKGKKEPFIPVGVIRNTNFTKDGSLNDSDIAYLDVEAKQFSTRKLEFGDLILEKSGGGPKQPVGRVIPFEKKSGDFSFSNFTSIVRIKDKTILHYSYLHKFLHYLYVTGATETMQRQSTGIRNLQLKEYKLIDVPFPPLPEQKRIVALLDTVFADLAQTRAKTEQNLKNARELFDSYLQQVFSQKGEGWVETTLGVEINLLTGFAFKSKEYVTHSNSIPLIRGDNIVQGKLRWDGVKLWSNDTVSEYQKYQLEVDDIVIAMDRTWVKAGMKFSKITSEDLPALLVQRVARLRSLKSINSDYLYHLVGSKLFESYVLSIQTGLGVPHISGKQIQSFSFNKPSIERQKALVSTMNDLKNKVQQLEAIYQQKLTAIDELKKSILQKAFNGELSQSVEQVKNQGAS